MAFSAWCGPAGQFFGQEVGHLADSRQTKGRRPGMHGWLCHSNINTSENRQILVTSVDVGSPVDGVLAVDDVILGANDTGAHPFGGWDFTRSWDGHDASEGYAGEVECRSGGQNAKAFGGADRGLPSCQGDVKFPNPNP